MLASNGMIENQAEYFVYFDDEERVDGGICPLILEKQAELLGEGTESGVVLQIPGDDGFLRNVYAAVAKATGKNKAINAVSETLSYMQDWNIAKGKIVYLELMGDVSLIEANDAAELLNDAYNDKELLVQIRFDHDGTDCCTAVLLLLNPDVPDRNQPKEK